MTRHLLILALLAGCGSAGDDPAQQRIEKPVPVTAKE